MQDCHGAKSEIWAQCDFFILGFILSNLFIQLPCNNIPEKCNFF